MYKYHVFNGNLLSNGSAVSLCSRFLLNLYVVVCTILIVCSWLVVRLFVSILTMESLATISLDNMITYCNVLRFLS